MPEVQKQQGKTADYVLSDSDLQEELACHSLFPLLYVAPLRSEGLFFCLGNIIL